MTLSVYPALPPEKVGYAPNVILTLVSIGTSKSHRLHPYQKGFHLTQEILRYTVETQRVVQTFLIFPMWLLPFGYAKVPFDKHSKCLYIPIFPTSYFFFVFYIFPSPHTSPSLPTHKHTPAWVPGFYWASLSLRYQQLYQQGQVLFRSSAPFALE